MPENKSDCILCDSEIIYSEQSLERKCVYCNREYISNAACKSGHFICDSCHGGEACEIITAYCLAVKDTGPFEMALHLMRHPSIKMHGPEHHYLIPAVLITVYCNAVQDTRDLAAKLKEAKKRAANILGGFCGFYGNCGAAVGAGIFMSIITKATPLSVKEWQAANLTTSLALNKIALHGGPRCCKRNTFLAIKTAWDFAKDYFKIDSDYLDTDSETVCAFFYLNKECKNEDCIFYPG